jgi:lipopolysaccharide export system protein LptC
MTGNPRNLLLSGIALLLLVLLWPDSNNQALYTEIPDQEAILQDDFDYYLDGVVTNRFTGQGVLSYRLVADRVMHFPDGDRAVLTTPRFTRYPEHQAPIEVSAKSGLLVPGTLEATDILELQEDVVLARTLDNGALLTARTASLLMDTGTETVSTADPVILESGRSELRGTGMKITLTDNRVELLADVRGHHE